METGVHNGITYNLRLVEAPLGNGVTVPSIFTVINFLPDFLPSRLELLELRQAGLLS